MAKEFKIKVATVKEVKNQKTGQKFNVYQTVDKTGKLMDLKFRRTCANIPTERCYIFVDDDQCNVSRRTEYPTLWVSNVNRIEPLAAGAGNVGEFFETAGEAEADDNPF